MNMLISLRSELLKTKRTASIYLVIAAAAFGPLMSMLDLLFDGVHPNDRAVIFNKMLTSKFQMTGFLVLPLFLIMVSALLPQIEYKNNTWKQVLASPQPRVTIFLSKFINFQLMIMLFLVANQLFMLVDAIILHFVEPSLGVLYQPLNGYDILMTTVNAFVGMLAMSAIQFWLGLRFRNFVATIAIGAALWITGTILVVQSHTGFAAWFPYSYHIYGNHPAYRPAQSAVTGSSLAYMVVFLLLGYWDFRKRKRAS